MFVILQIIFQLTFSGHSVKATSKGKGGGQGVLGSKLYIVIYQSFYVDVYVVGVDINCTLELLALEHSLHKGF